MRCSAKTKKGTRCKNSRLTDRDVCKQHSGDANIGKRSSLTPELLDLICRALRAGSFIEPACIASGIHESTFYSWRERGEADLENGVESKYAEFVEATTRARAEGEVGAVATVRRAGAGRAPVFDKKTGEMLDSGMPGDWRAAAWLLERGHRERWGKVHEISGPGGGPITLAAAEALLDEALNDEEVEV